MSRRILGVESAPRGGAVWRAVQAVEVMAYTLFAIFLILMILVQESANEALSINPFGGADAVPFLLLATRVVYIAAVSSSIIVVWAVWKHMRSRSKARLVSYSLLSAGCILALIRSPLTFCYVWGACVG